MELPITTRTCNYASHCSDPKYHSCVPKNEGAFVWQILTWHTWGVPHAFVQPGSSLGRLWVGALRMACPRSERSSVAGPWNCVCSSVCKNKSCAPLENSAHYHSWVLCPLILFQRRYSDLVWLVVTKVFLCLMIPLTLSLSFHSCGIYDYITVTLQWLRGPFFPLMCLPIFPSGK